MSSQRVSFETYDNIINGERRSGSSKTQGIDPSTGEPLWDVAAASKDELNEAVVAAQKAFPEWSRTTWEHRQSLLTKLKEVVLSYTDELTELVMKEAGKPVSISMLRLYSNLNFWNRECSPMERSCTLLGSSISMVGSMTTNMTFAYNYVANAKLPERTVIQDDDEVLITERYVPIGVVGAICPWNFPLVLATGKIAAALVTGNCVIVKPSPFTPYSVLKLAEMAQDIFPPGVLQALNGDDKLGPLIVSHPGIGKISFTGSTATGKRIMEAASKTLKNVTLELGGNNATIICPDINIEKVASQVALGAFFNSGQLCVASKRIYVHEDIYAEFLKALTAVVKSWKTGPVSQQDVMLGPVQNKQQSDIIQSFHDDCKKNGYTYALGSEGKMEGGGFSFHPAIIDNPPDSSKIVTEEPFGKFQLLLKV